MKMHEEYYRFFWARTLIFKKGTLMSVYGPIVEMIHPCFEPIEYLRHDNNNRRR